MRQLIEQFLKFGVVGVIAFFIDFGVMVALVELCHMDAVIAAGISFVVSVIFNYVASMRYVFEHREDISRRREFVIFVILSAIGLVINEAIMYGGEWAFTAAGVDYTGGPYYMGVKIFATAVVMVWNFVSRKIWLDGSNKGTDAEGNEPQGDASAGDKSPQE